ncbi:MAG: T9SS type A sorting domain-containing protein [Balneolales bacterium]|nr:T9SS type A sorting domain-containing protein [Balneolales bacterium]
MKQHLQTGIFTLLVAAFLFTGFTSVNANTIEVRTWNDLNNVRNNLSASYMLMNDLDSETAGFSAYQGAEGFMPIGSSADPFTGTFNGNGYKIHNLKINRATPNVGLFSFTLEATIQNLGLVDVDITAQSTDSGVLIGRAHATIVDKSYATGTFTQTSVESNSSFGGLVGRFHGGMMVSSWSEVNLTVVGLYAGGLIGSVSGFGGTPALIDRCYATGNVSASTRMIGGLIGQFGGSSTINNSYASGNAVGDTQVGGLIGYKWRGATVTNSYARGVVNGTGQVGGLIGFRDPDQPPVVSTIENSYWKSDNAGAEAGVGSGKPDGVTGLTEAQLKTEASFSSWNFTDIWGINPDFNNGYPYLIYQLTTSIEDEVEIPNAVLLSQNYPNPFNPSTVIGFSLPQTDHVKLEVYTVNGQLISTLVNETRSAGLHEVRFDASNLSSGVYIYRVITGSDIQTRRMTLIK